MPVKVPKRKEIRTVQTKTGRLSFHPYLAEKATMGMGKMNIKKPSNIPPVCRLSRSRTPKTATIIAPKVNSCVFVFINRNIHQIGSVVNLRI
jgi:hypothetical protein